MSPQNAHMSEFLSLVSKLHFSASKDPTRVSTVKYLNMLVMHGSKCISLELHWPVCPQPPHHLKPYSTFPTPCWTCQFSSAVNVMNKKSYRTKMTISKPWKLALIRQSTNNLLDYIPPVRLGKGELGLRSRDGFIFTWSLKSCRDTRSANTDCPS